MADATFRVNRAGWKQAFATTTGTLGTWVRVETNKAELAISREAPSPGGVAHNMTGISYATGELAASHTSRVVMSRGVPEGHIIALPKHAKFVVGGTRPHVIRPKTPGGMLRFYWRRVGKFMVLPKVNHPGTAANNYMFRALQRQFRNML